jgi:hypothetical protein
VKKSKILEVEFCNRCYFVAVGYFISRETKLMNASKCPVCDWAINDGGIKVTVAGKEITVCCDECAEKVKQDPAKYAAK